MPALTLADAKEQLGITDEDYDGELQGYVDSVITLVESRIGPVDDVSVTERWRGGGESIALRWAPVVEVTEVARLDGGAGLDVSELDVDHDLGVLRLVSDHRWPLGRWRIVYTAGRGGEAPAAAQTAARIIMQHLWSVKRGTDPRRADIVAEDTVAVPGVGFAVPRRALELLAPHASPAVA